MVSQDCTHLASKMAESGLNATKCAVPQYINTYYQITPIRTRNVCISPQLRELSSLAGEVPSQIRAYRRDQGRIPRAPTFCFVEKFVSARFLYTIPGPCLTVSCADGAQCTTRRCYDSGPSYTFCFQLFGLSPVKVVIPRFGLPN